MAMTQNQHSTWDPVACARADLKKLSRALALSDQNPEVLKNFPPGYREALEERVSSIRALLASMRTGRLQGPPSPLAVDAHVERVHARWERRRTPRTPAQRMLDRRQHLSPEKKAARRMRLD